MGARITKAERIDRGCVDSLLLQGKHLVAAAVDSLRQRILVGREEMGLAEIIASENEILVGQFVIDTDKEKILAANPVGSGNRFSGTIAKNAPVDQRKEHQKRLDRRHG